MEIRYQIFEKENLLVEKFTGDLSVELYLQYAGYIMRHPLRKSISKVLIDFRDILFEDLYKRDFDEVVDKMKEIRENARNNEIQMRDTKVVFWVDKPIPTVIAHIFKNSFPNYNYYSSEKHVIENLEIPEHLTNLENIVENLENTF
ncbi:MAG: hypothetical protein JXB24_11455 [Bacteroidales bacterium]|nr:hypothetical protein [Bacteroidales bacterium]